MASKVAQPVGTNSTQMANTGLNPVRTASRKIVHVTLQFDGVNFDPNALRSALDTAYGTVASDKDVMSRDTYIFNISP